MRTLYLWALPAVFLATAAQTATAADVKVLNNTGTNPQTRSAADYTSAQTLKLHVTTLPESVFDYNGAAASAQRQAPKVTPGHRGAYSAAHLASELNAPTGTVASGAIAPEAVGTGGVHFTSSRVYPKGLDVTYPVSTVGKLYFTIGSSNYMCTGSMIKPGVVVTAGHCVHSGNAASTGWYSNFEFIPGYRKQGSKLTTPFGRWSGWASVVVSNGWYYGGGGVPNSEDFAVIIFNADGAGRRIGDYTGWLGWGTGLAIGRHSTVLGYPANLDSAGQLHRVDSMVTDYGSLSTGVWGSDMQGGSSGGPVVLNWRVNYSDSSTNPSENWGNIVTSVVSWGYVSTSPKVQGGSAFSTSFASLMDYTCTTYSWAC